ncbi:peptidoglycan recognition protein family protein [Kitasatospora brasiliensis]|uniref:peptidoglycan recognition protein family protein n=1 Tax=Kitasatospora brasiliensis TaxID=3058040 RepID=UPI00292F0C6A|nr:N-acetylmuramoyl-L-alanine amidase [Kitasatospora sp. K002]
MRLSLPAAILAGCTATLLLQPVATATTGPAPQRRDFAGGGSTTSLPLPSGTGLAPRGTRPFELLGLDWDGPPDALAGAVVRVRTRDAATGRWSDWHRLESDVGDGPDQASHGATAPLWTGRSDGVAVDVRPGPAGPPPGLRVDLVDPGGGAAPASAVRTLPAEEPGMPSAELPAALLNGRAPRPEIVTRAGWGADESLRDQAFDYTGPVHEVFIHHTATATGYDCSDAPRVIRAIYQYHVKTNGWRDIGYNFLVDRCGTIYEGRAGGVDQPVHGAHTLGFNAGSTGIAAIGTYAGDQPPQRLLDGLAEIAAWKLGLTDTPAAGRTQLTSGSNSSRYPQGSVADLDTISGHRDAVATECPGDALYTRLPALRTTAARLQAR